MPRVDRPENLKPITSVEQAREMGSKGGKKSAEVKKERKLLSTIYAEMLAGRFDVTDELGNKEKVEGQEYMRRVASAILSRNDSAAVSMLKEIREATEGNKTHLSGEIGVTIVDDIG